MKLGHYKEFLRLRQSEGLASDERLTLEVLALQTLHGGRITMSI